ncbi:MAG: HAD family hydrolase [Pseudomonadota bacterium]
MKPYDAILFDKDGTLYDFQGSYGHWARDLVSHLAGDDGALAECLAAEIDLDLANGRFGPSSVAIAGTAHDIAEAFLPHLRDPPERSTLIRWIDDSAMSVPLQEAVPLSAFLASLSALGYQLGVVTNDSEAPARVHLAQSGILESFQFVAGYDSGHGAKPAPGPLLAGAAALGVEPRRVVMVGDSRHDLLAGRAAGMATVAVLTGLASPEDLDPLADAVLPDIGHLTAWLGAQP